MLQKFFPSYLRKHATMIIICILLIVVVFNMFWRISIFEANDPNMKPPIMEEVSVTIKDTTKPANVIDPEAVGKYYVSTSEDKTTKHLIEMGKDASNVSLRFNSMQHTSLYIRPISVESNDKHKANIFPPNFTLVVKFPVTTKKYKIQFQDLSSNQPRNVLVKEKEGKYIMSISYANSIMKAPLYLDETPQSSVGNIDVSVKNQFTINVNESGNKIPAFMLALTST